MKLYLLSIVLLFSTNAYSQADSLEHRLTYDYFKTHLSSEMNYEEITKTFGQPNQDIGSGLYIYDYILADSTTMVIGCAQKVFYAYHMDANGRMLDTLMRKED